MISLSYDDVIIYYQNSQYEKVKAIIDEFKNDLDEYLLIEPIIDNKSNMNNATNKIDEKINYTNNIVEEISIDEIDFGLKIEEFGRKNENIKLEKSNIKNSIIDNSDISSKSDVVIRIGKRKKK